MGFLLRTALAALAIWLAVAVVGGLDFQGTLVELVLVALLMGVVNALGRPVLQLLSLPFVILTLGLFLLVINIVLFAVVVALAEPLGLGLTSTGFGPTALGALVTTAVVAVGGWLLPD